VNFWSLGSFAFHVNSRSYRPLVCKIGGFNVYGGLPDSVGFYGGILRFLPVSRPRSSVADV